MGLHYAGDPSWFYRLTHEEQVMVDAYHRSKEKAAGPDMSGIKWAK